MQGGTGHGLGTGRLARARPGCSTTRGSAHALRLVISRASGIAPNTFERARVLVCVKVYKLRYIDYTSVHY